MSAYLAAAVLVLAAVAVRLLLNPVIGDEGGYLTVFPAVLLCGAILGRGPGILAAVVGVAAIEVLYCGKLSGAVFAVRAALIFASAAMVAWLGAKTRELRALPAQVGVTPSPALTPTPSLAPKPEVQLSDAVAIAESARRSRERFLGQISHELRTPLISAMAALEKIPEGSRRDEVNGLLHRELRLVDDLLDVTRLTNAKLPMYLRPASLHEVIQESARLCAEQLRTRGQKLTLELAADKDQVNADPARLAQALSAILSNASKFSPERGPIGISTAIAGKRVRILVEDTGGVQPATLAQIFEAFEQGEADRFGGLGLGLTISRGLILLHGGTIKITSEGEGKGTRVEVVLPLLEQLPEEPTLFASSA